MKEIHLQAPRGWREITATQLLDIAKMYDEQLPEEEFLVRCLIALTGIVPIEKKVGVEASELLFYYSTPEGEEFSLTAAETASLAGQLRWVIDGVDLCKPPENIAGLQPVNARLFGVTLDEYLLADQLYGAYSQSKNIDTLNRFAAVFYRKNAAEWDERNYRRYCGAMVAVPKHAKTAVYIWFTGVKKWLQQKYPYLFSGADGGESSLPEPDEHILRLLTALNGGDVTKNRDILRTQVHEVFFALNFKLENADQHV